MLRKLTAKLKGRERERAPDECAAVPYTEPSNDSGGDGGQQNGGSPTASRASSSSSPGRGPGPAAAAAAAAAAYEGGLALGNAAAKGDIDAIMKMLKAGVDVNEADKVKVATRMYVCINYYIIVTYSVFYMLLIILRITMFSLPFRCSS